MEADHPPDPWSLIIRLIKRMPDDAREQLVALLQQTIELLNPVTGHVQVVQADQTIEAYGVVHAPTVEIVPAGAATGTISITGHATGVAPPLQPRVAPLVWLWHPDLLIAAFVILVFLSFHDRSFTEGLAELLRELCRLYIELALGTAFVRRQQPRARRRARDS